MNKNKKQNKKQNKTKKKTKKNNNNNNPASYTCLHDTFLQNVHLKNSAETRFNQINHLFKFTMYCLPFYEKQAWILN